jgi:hypothetical protein
VFVCVKRGRVKEEKERERERGGEETIENKER